MWFCVGATFLYKVMGIVWAYPSYVILIEGVLMGLTYVMNFNELVW